MKECQRSVHSASSLGGVNAILSWGRETRGRTRTQKTFVYTDDWSVHESQLTVDTPSSRDVSDDAVAVSPGTTRSPGTTTDNDPEVSP